MVRENVKKKLESPCELRWLVWILRFCCSVNILSLDGTRAFLHFVCASFFCENFKRSKGGACLPFEGARG